MKIKKINKKKLCTKVLEDGIKKSIELAIVGTVVGLSPSTLLLTIAGVTGGSFYCENNKIDFIGDLK